MTLNPSLGDYFREARRGPPSVKPLVQYQNDPLAYCFDKLKLKPESLNWGLNLPLDHPWDGTPEPLCTAFVNLAAGKDVGIESATGTGKSVLGAAAMCWFLASWELARVFTFASKEEQLRLYIWTELRRLGLFDQFRRSFPDATLTDLCLRVRGGQDNGWSAHGYGVAIRAGEEVSAKAAGMHATDQLLIYEETQGIHQAVIEAGFNTSTAPHNLRLFLGNPDHQLDALHRACTSPGVSHIRISALDHPNVVTGKQIVPGAVSKEKVEVRRLQYGEADRLYQSRVRGISPAESSEALIKLEWVKRAQERWKAREREALGHGIGLREYAKQWGQPALGLDVANSEDGDFAAVATGYGHICLEITSEVCPNANQFGFKIAKRMEADNIPDRFVGVDTVGVGAGCFNEMMRLQKYVRSLNGGAGAEYEHGSEEEYANLRAQMHWRLREDLRLDRVDLPPDDELARDLVTPTWGPRNGKILVEPKEKIKERLPSGRSPNKGDAVVYWNFVRDRSALVSGVPKDIKVVAGDPITSDLQFDRDSVFEETGPEEWVQGSMRSYGIR